MQVASLVTISVTLEIATFHAINLPAIKVSRLTAPLNEKDIGEEQKQRVLFSFLDITKVSVELCYDGELEELSQKIKTYRMTLSRRQQSNFDGKQCLDMAL